MSQVSTVNELIEQLKAIEEGSRLVLFNFYTADDLKVSISAYYEGNALDELEEADLISMFKSMYEDEEDTAYFNACECVADMMNRDDDDEEEDNNGEAQD